MGASQGQGHKHEEKTSEMEVTVSTLQCETTAALRIHQAIKEHTETRASYGSEDIYSVCSSVIESCFGE